MLISNITTDTQGHAYSLGMESEAKKFSDNGQEDEFIAHRPRMGMDAAVKGKRSVYLHCYESLPDTLSEKRVRRLSCYYL